MLEYAEPACRSVLPSAVKFLETADRRPSNIFRRTLYCRLGIFPVCSRSSSDSKSARMVILSSYASTKLLSDSGCTAAAGATVTCVDLLRYITTAAATAISPAQIVG